MKPVAIRTLWSFNGLGRARWVRSLAGTGWPALAGFGAVMVGVLMLGAAAYFQWQASQLMASSTQAISGRGLATRTSTQLPAADGSLLQAPAYGTHLEDVGKLFKLAKEKGVNIGTIEYRSETSAALPILIRTLDLRINEEYPKFKAFVAELLSSMPHVFLQEIQVEQGNANSTKEQIMLKLSFVYQDMARPQ